MLPVLRVPEVSEYPFDIPKGEVFDLGYGARITRNPMGQFCGYISVPPEHPWHGLPFYPDLDHVACHGGLTYAEPDDESDHWWVGFDCNHPGDGMDIFAITNSKISMMAKMLQAMYPEDSKSLDPEYIQTNVILLLSQAYLAYQDANQASAG